MSMPWVAWGIIPPRGMKGISLHEVVCTVHMTLEIVRLCVQMVDELITDLAEYLDVIAQDVHPVVGSGTSAQCHGGPYRAGY